MRSRGNRPQRKRDVEGEGEGQMADGRWPGQLRPRGSVRRRQREPVCQTGIHRAEESGPRWARRITHSEQVVGEVAPCGDNHLRGVGPPDIFKQINSRYVHSRHVTVPVRHPEVDMPPGTPNVGKECEAGSNTHRLL